MGYYNPHAPQIIGQEWVPIRDENTTFSPQIRSVEQGHSFSLSTATQVRDSRYYLNQLYPQNDRSQTVLVSIYPKGKEAESGPVQRVVIPVRSATITGGSVFGAADAVSAVLSEAAGSGISWDTTQSYVGGHFQFNVSQYPQLAGKRILTVNLLNSTDGGEGGSVFITATTVLPVVSQFAIFGRFGEDVSEAPHINHFGEINPLWRSSAAPTTPLNSARRMPWSYRQLQRLDNSADLLYVMLETGASENTGDANFPTTTYLALEVFYCEEQRVAFGAMQYGTTFTASNTGISSIIGANPIPLTDQALYQASSGGSTGDTFPVLPAGEYTTIVTAADIGDYNNTRSVLSFPDFNALRQIYPMPDQPGVQVNLPSPLEKSTVGQTFTKQETFVLPQLSLHSSGGPLKEVHAYGRQAIAQVYGSITATQETLDPSTGPAVYPWVRFYARRFGDTTAPLRLTSPTITGAPGLLAQITVSEFDDLEEIIDGWKEITLRVSPAPTMGQGLNQQWVWTSDGQTAGNRWEVLGATAPAISGIPASAYTLVPSPNQLSSATYGMPNAGASINLGWIPGYAPPVTTTTDDETSDAVILWSQDPHPVSGFAIQQLNLPLSGIGMECGVAPEFVPTAMAYNQLTWNMDPTTTVLDTFTRTAVASWGSADSGQTYGVLGGSSSDYSVNSGSGNILLTTTNAYRLTTLTSGSMLNVHGYGEIWSNMAASGSDHWGALTIRSDGSGNQWYAEVNWPTDGTAKLILSSVTGSSVHTVLGTATFANRYVPGTRVKVRVEATGPSFRAKAWLETDDEPVDWMIQTATSQNNAAGFVGTRSIVGAGSPLPTIMYDNIQVWDLSIGYTEIQRMDDITDWQTIAKITNPTVTSFNDYEARVGILTSYRIRNVNVYGFEGPWSSVITATTPAPGVTASGLGATDHVLIFTTNAVQAGSSNLAYALGWEGEVREEFDFPEANQQTFQTMYDRDFVTVFRPFERGGTNFSRTILVQAAAIPPETLEDFTSLRNMAWADVPYICVKDEEGNRWFANVSVPTGAVVHFRKLYFANIMIVEVTDTPAPVNP